MVYEDTINYPIDQTGSPTNWQSPVEPNYSGNPNTSKVYVSTGAITGSSPTIATHAQFDRFGNQIKAWDAKGNTTETSYASPSGQDYKFAFPTKVTSEIPDPTPSQNYDYQALGSQTAFFYGSDI